eukprot:GILK01007696.1.p1 GENE.GILK01007696.1~~GILK01007696.1.p1  ORF type:complete len:1761 (+),score=394.49 GILK01007696.1:64-5283(+)
MDKNDLPDSATLLAILELISANEAKIQARLAGAAASPVLMGEGETAAQDEYLASPPVVTFDIKDFILKDVDISEQGLESLFSHLFVPAITNATELASFIAKLKTAVTNAERTTRYNAILNHISSFIDQLNLSADIAFGSYNVQDTDSISTDVFVYMFRDLKVPIADEDLHFLCSYLAVKADNQVDFRSFLNEMQHRNPSVAYQSDVRSFSFSNWHEALWWQLANYIRSSGVSLQDAILQYDTDNSGTLSAAEFGELLDRLGLHLLPEQQQQLLQQFEFANSDGSLLNVKAFLRSAQTECSFFLSAPTNPAIEHILDTIAQRLFDRQIGLKQVLTQLKITASDTVDIRGMRMILSHLKIRYTESELTALVKTFDWRGDGRVVLPELDRQLNQRPLGPLPFSRFKEELTTTEQAAENVLRKLRKRLMEGDKAWFDAIARASSTHKNGLMTHLEFFDSLAVHKRRLQLTTSELNCLIDDLDWGADGFVSCADFIRKVKELPLLNRTQPAVTVQASEQETSSAAADATTDLETESSPSSVRVESPTKMERDVRTWSEKIYDFILFNLDRIGLPLHDAFVLHKSFAAGTVMQRKDFQRFLESKWATKLSVDDLERLSNALDMTGDSRVTVEELIRRLKVRSDSKAIQLKEKKLRSAWVKRAFHNVGYSIQRTGLTVSQAFCQTNSDATLFISREEFKLALRRLHVHMSEQVVSELMEWLDTGRNGKVSMIEIARGLNDKSYVAAHSSAGGSMSSQGRPAVSVAVVTSAQWFEDTIVEIATRTFRLSRSLPSLLTSHDNNNTNNSNSSHSNKDVYVSIVDFEKVLGRLQLSLSDTEKVELTRRFELTQDGRLSVADFEKKVLDIYTNRRNSTDETEKHKYPIPVTEKTEIDILLERLLTSVAPYRQALIDKLTGVVVYPNTTELLETKASNKKELKQKLASAGFVDLSEGELDRIYRAIQAPFPAVANLSADRLAVLANLSQTGTLWKEFVTRLMERELSIATKEATQIRKEEARKSILTGMIHVLDRQEISVDTFVSLFDISKDGFIGVDELIFGVHMCRIGLDFDQLDDFIDALDINQDGELSLAELKTALENRSTEMKRAGLKSQPSVEENINSLLLEMKAKIAKMGISLYEMFERFDTNGDGAISANELQEALIQLGIDVTDSTLNTPRFPSRFNSLLSVFDVNGDGKISYSELAQQFNIPNRAPPPFGYVPVAIAVPSTVHKLRKQMTDLLLEEDRVAAEPTVNALCTKIRQMTLTVSDVFKRLDIAGTGIVSRRMLARGLHFFRICPSPEELSALFMILDPNRLNRIFLGEFKDLLQQKLLQSQSYLFDERAKELQFASEWLDKEFYVISKYLKRSKMGLQSALNLFQSLANENGGIQREPFHNLLKKFGIHATVPDLTGVFESLDLDRDGLLSFQEFSERICQYLITTRNFESGVLRRKQTMSMSISLDENKNKSTKTNNDDSSNHQRNNNMDCRSMDEIFQVLYYRIPREPGVPLASYFDDHGVDSKQNRWVPVRVFRNRLHSIKVDLNWIEFSDLMSILEVCRDDRVSLAELENQFKVRIEEEREKLQRASKPIKLRENSETEGRKYLEQHQILLLFDHLTTLLTLERPQAIEPFLVERLKELQSIRDHRTDNLGFFTTEDVQAMFGMWDIRQQGQINQEHLNFTRSIFMTQPKPSATPTPPMPLLPTNRNGYGTVNGNDKDDDDDDGADKVSQESFVAQLMRDIQDRYTPGLLNK